MNFYSARVGCGALIIAIGSAVSLQTTADARPNTVASATAENYAAKLARYVEARRAYEAEAAAYWKAITEKRRTRIAKRARRQPVALSDYVLTQPPVYDGPPRPIDPAGPAPDPTERPRPAIPTVADFIAAAAEEFGFVPDRPESELAFKQAYAQVAAAAGLTRDQLVGIYIFETGGRGTYDMQAGVSPTRPGSKPISPALGYNQLLSTNSIGLVAEHGDRIIAGLRHKAAELPGNARVMMERKIEALRRMVAFCRSVPHAWSEHDRLAKTTRPGIGVHAVVLDRDIGPLLQTQKLINSVHFARRKGYAAPLTAAELELMNFTGDGNGIDMVMMPADFRREVPTANFFQRDGYERNPIARRTGTVAGLIASIEAKMQAGANAPGARDLAAAFPP